MNHRNLPRVNTADAVKSEAPFPLHVRRQPLFVLDVGVDGSNRLHPRSAGRIDGGLPCEETLPPFDGPRRTEFGRQIFEAQGQSDDRRIGGRNLECPVNSEGRLENRHEEGRIAAHQIDQNLSGPGDPRRVLDFGQQHRVRVVSGNGREVLFSRSSLIDPYHAFGHSEVEGDEGVAHEGAGRVFFGRWHRVLEIENDAVGGIKTGGNHELGLVARNVETAAAEAISLTLRPTFRCRRGQYRRAVAPGAAKTGLGPRQNHPLQRTGVVNFQSTRSDTEVFRHPPHCALDRGDRRDNPPWTRFRGSAGPHPVHRQP